MSEKGKKCYGDYVPWVRRLKLEELEKRVLSIGQDEGVKLNVQTMNGKTAKIFVNKTGQEHTITIVSDDSREETFVYDSGRKAYDALKRLVKTINEAFLY